MIANCLDEFSTGDDRSSVRRREGTHFGWDYEEKDTYSFAYRNYGKNIFRICIIF